MPRKDPPGGGGAVILAAEMIANWPRKRASERVALLQELYAIGVDAERMAWREGLR